MLIAHFETAAGPLTIGLVDLSQEEMQVPFKALMTTLSRMNGPTLHANAHAVVSEAPLGTPATLTFKHLGARAMEFADQKAFFASVKEHLARHVLQCAADFEVGVDGRITGEFEYFEVIEKELPHCALPTGH